MGKPKQEKSQRVIKQSIYYIWIVLIIFFQNPSSGRESVPEYSVHTVDAVFLKIKGAVSNVRRVSGHFTQEKRTDILKQTLYSSGRFYFELNGRLDWEITEPSPRGFAVEGQKVKRWKDNPENAQIFQLEQAPAIKAFADQVFAWMRADFKSLKQNYRILLLEEMPPTMKLVPLSSTESGYLDYLKVVFSKNFSHVTAVEIHESGGDSTVIQFKNTLINGPIPKSLF